ncbi:MAG: hypothetical protein IT233_08920 [Bacteroidia bacterium]|nr:hypothetical protein [Bacteroidia bacterium]
MSSFFVWLGLFSLAPFWGMAQADSLFSAPGDTYGVIKVQRPGIVPVVEVLLKYRPAQSHRKKKLKDGAAFLNDQKNMIPNGLIGPEPFYIANQDREKYLRLSETANTLYFDLDSFFSENIAYKYAWLRTPCTDTIRLVARINRSGEAEYSYLNENGQKSQVEKKCFEALSLILKWTPAREVRYTGQGTRIRRSRRVHCSVELIIVLSAGSPDFFLVEDSVVPQ